MDGLLERLKRERRWTVIFFLGSIAVIGVIRLTLAPEVDAPLPDPIRVEATP